MDTHNGSPSKMMHAASSIINLLLNVNSCNMNKTGHIRGVHGTSIIVKKTTISDSFMTNKAISLESKNSHYF